MVLRKVGLPSSGTGSADPAITLSPLAEAVGLLCDHQQTPGPDRTRGGGPTRWP